MLSGIINSQGLVVPYNDILSRCGNKMVFRKILKSLTIIEKSKSKPKGAPLLVKYAYLQQKNTITFPKIKASIFLKHKLIDNIQIEFEIIPRTINKQTESVELYGYQKDIISYVCNSINDTITQLNHGICYLQMDTGLGKSRVGCAIINHFCYAALIVVPTIAIGIQWIEEYKILYPDGTIIFYHNNKNIDVSIYSVVVVVINTFCKKSINFLEGFGILIFDEAHEYYTSCNSKALWLAQTKIVLGLSATPLERPDELDKYITLHLGQPIYADKVVDISEVNFVGSVKSIWYYGDRKYVDTVTTEKGVISTILTINNIIQDPLRINLIIREAKRLYEKGHGIFIFAEHRNFLDVLKNHLMGYNVTIEDDLEISVLKGGISKQELLDAKNKGAHIILTTYGYSRRGISITEMTSLIMASPRRNGIKQIIGRIFRRGSDESIVREIIDIIDTRSILKNQYYDRKKIYFEKKYNISNEYVKNDPTEIEDETEEELPNYGLDEIQFIVNKIYEGNI